MGDAGWAGGAESFSNDPAKPAYLIYRPGTNVLELFDEALSLLPPEQRWNVTFSTFFTDLPLNLTCVRGERWLQTRPPPRRQCGRAQGRSCWI